MGHRSGSSPSHARRRLLRPSTSEPASGNADAEWCPRPGRGRMMRLSTDLSGQPCSRCTFTGAPPSAVSRERRTLHVRSSQAAGQAASGSSGTTVSLRARADRVSRLGLREAESPQQEDRQGAGHHAGDAFLLPHEDDQVAHLRQRRGATTPRTRVGRECPRVRLLVGVTLGVQHCPARPRRVSRWVHRARPAARSATVSDVTRLVAGLTAVRSTTTSPGWIRRHHRPGLHDVQRGSRACQASSDRARDVPITEATITTGRGRVRCRAWMCHESLRQSREPVRVVPRPRAGTTHSGCWWISR